ncbi:MAG: AAA family ATPase [Bacteroidia bacterium]|nr:AAA family ATPase [Bacteroidia bacterium]MDW8157525.1 AAA family ATPase [Bacteroidia bacterium]
MIIHFEYLGPIQEGKVELGSGLTIFTGPNQTGKTWASYCIYALHNRHLFKVYHSELRTACENFIANSIVEIDIWEWWQNYKEILCEQLALQFKDKLPTLFSLPAYFFERTKIQLFPSAEDATRWQSLPKFEWLRVFEKAHRIQLEKAARSSIIRLRLVDSQAPLQELDKETQSRMLLFLQEQLSDCILRIFLPEVYFATAERAAIYIFTNELSLLNRNLSLETRILHKLNRQLPVYSLPLADALNLVDFASATEPGPCLDLATMLEKEIVHGHYTFKPEGSIFFVPEEESNIEIPLMAAAGGIQQMAGIVWLLKYVVNPGDYLIIDSPELMLHPEKQRLLARCIARMVNAGIKLLIITHSLSILQELTHLALPAEPGTDLYQVRKTEFLKSKEILPDMILNAANIRSYIFRNGSIFPLPIGPSGPLDMVGYSSTIL